MTWQQGKKLSWQVTNKNMQHEYPWSIIRIFNTTCISCICLTQRCHKMNENIPMDPMLCNVSGDDFSFNEVELTMAMIISVCTYTISKFITKFLSCCSFIVMIFRKMFPKYAVFSNYRADSRSAPNQWDTALHCNDASHWLGGSLQSDLNYMISICFKKGISTSVYMYI